MTTIKLKVEVCKMLRAAGTPAESYNDIIKKLLKKVSRSDFMEEQYAILDKEKNWTPLNAPIVQFHPPDRRSWRAWLERNHKTARGVWLVFSKKRASSPSLSYTDAVEEALAFGWIDSRGKRIDAERTMLMMSPRRPKSPWAKVNKERVQRLMELGLMAPAGLEKVEAAKRDGSWSIMDGVAELRFPPDLKKALAADGKARAWFGASGRTYIRLALQWIATAKRPETRARRISEIVRLAARGEKANQYVPKQTPQAGKAQGATPSGKRKS